MTDWTAAIHLPGLSLTGARDGLSGGRLAFLDFDSWYAMDGTHIYADNKFARNRPLFWLGTLQADNMESVADALLRKAADIHRLLLLHPLAPPLAAPGLSCLYAGAESKDGHFWYRLIGPAEREWIVFGGVPAFAFDDDDLGLLDDVAALLEAVPESQWPPELCAALDVLERTARPEYQFALDDPVDGLAGFVEAIAACEGLVSGGADREDDPGETLTAAFARKTADLFAPEDVAEQDLVGLFRDIYSLRSRLIHGRLGSDDVDQEQAEKVMAGRRFLRNCCVAALSKLDR